MNYSAGEHRLASMIDSGRVVGYRVVGQAAGPLLGDRWYDGGDTTRLIRSGPGADTLVRLAGRDAIVRDVTLAGSPFGSTERGKCGIHVARDLGGIGQGKHKLDNVYITKFEAGIQFGDLPGEGNCDETVARSVSVNECGVGVRMINRQSMGHKFYDFKLYDTPIGFDISGGGKFKVDGFFSPSPCTVLRIARAGGDTIGSSNSRFTFENVYLDKQAGDSLIYDLLPGARYVRTVFNGLDLHAENYGDAPAFRMAPSMPSWLTIRDASWLKAGMFEWDCSLAPQSVTIELSQCWELDRTIDLFPPSQGKGPLNVTVWGLDCNDGRKMESIETTIMGTRK